MDSTRCTADSLVDEVNKMFRNHAKRIKSASKADVKEVVASAAKELKETSPKKSGKYAAGWRGKITEDRDERTVGIVHNVNKPGLAHLLEHGHAGPSPAPAKPHIEKAYNNGKAELEKRMK